MNAVTPKLSISYDTGDVAYDPVEQEFTLSTEVLTSGFEVALEVTDADQATNVYLLSARLLGTRPSVVGSIANLKLGKGGRTAVATAPVFSGRDLTYSLVAAPVGVSIDAATGLVTIVATAELSAAPITVKARNAAGAANAVVAAQMALAGIQSVIPPDEIIDAMYEIGCQLPACLRETSQAGLATTPTGQKIAEKLGQN